MVEGVLGDKKRKRGAKRRRAELGGRREGVNEKQKQRSPEDVIKECIPQMTRSIEHVFTRDAGVFQVEFKFVSDITDEPAAGRLFLEISRVDCKKGTDVRGLTNTLSGRLANDKNLERRPGENVRLFTPDANDARKIRVHFVGPKDEGRYKDTEQLVQRATEHRPLTDAELGIKASESPILAKLRGWYTPKQRGSEHALPDDASPAIQAVVGKVAAERNKAQARLVEIEGRYSTVRRELDNMTRTVGEREKEIRTLNRQIATLQQESEAKLAEKIAELEGKLARVESAKTTAEKRADQAEKVEKERKKELENAIREHKGNYDELLKKFNAAHGDLHTAQKNLEATETSRLAVVQELAAARALEDQRREHVANLEGRLAKASSEHETASLQLSRMQRLVEDNARLEKDNIDLTARLESGERRVTSAEGLASTSAEDQGKIDSLTSRVTTAEREREAILKVFERFSMLVRRLGMQDLPLESRDSVVATARLFNALDEDRVSGAPERLTATNKLLDEFEAIVSKGASRT